MYVSLRRLRRAFLLTFLSALLIPGGTAHGAIVHGTVTDPLGAPVAGATVALVQGGKVVTNSLTDAYGGFTMSVGVGGRFIVLASGPSFRQVSTQSFYAGKLDSVQKNVV